MGLFGGRPWDIPRKGPPTLTAGNFQKLKTKIQTETLPKAFVRPAIFSIIPPGPWCGLPVRRTRCVRYFGGSKPAAFQRSAIAGPVSAAVRARAEAGSVLLAGIAAA